MKLANINLKRLTPAQVEAVKGTNLSGSMIVLGGFVFHRSC